MLSSRNKNKIYALTSASVIIIVIGSFILAVNFLLGINKFVFSVDERIVKEKTTVFDSASYAQLKNKLDSLKK